MWNYLTLNPKEKERGHGDGGRGQRGSALGPSSQAPAKVLRNGVIFKGHLELQIARATKERKGPRKEGLLHQSLSSSTASQPIWVPPVSAASISHARDCAVIPRFVRGSVSSLPLKQRGKETHKIKQESFENHSEKGKPWNLALRLEHFPCRSWESKENGVLGMLAVQPGEGLRAPGTTGMGPSRALDFKAPGLRGLFRGPCWLPRLLGTLSEPPSWDCDFTP